jgi:Lipopolysaccharide-assembly
MTSKKVHDFLTVAFTATLGLGACGYQFQVEGPGPTIGSGRAAIETSNRPRIAIPLFENMSFEPNLEAKYTAYTRHEFAAGSGAQVVTASEEADLILKGQIITVILPTLTFDINRTLETRTTVYVNVSVQERQTGKMVWNQTVTASSEFFVTDDLQFNRVLQTRALEQAGRLIAEDLATRFLDHVESGSLAKAAASKEGVAPASGIIPGLPVPGSKGTR